MSDQDSLLDVLDKQRTVTNRSDVWRTIADLLSTVEAIGRDGCVVLIKIDGLRPKGDVYTVIIQGGPLGQRYFHRDGSDLASLLDEAITYYRTHAKR